jgi:hypothetical protein
VQTRLLLDWLGNDHFISEWLCCQFILLFLRDYSVLCSPLHVYAQISSFRSRYTYARAAKSSTRGPDGGAGRVRIVSKTGGESGDTSDT